MSIVQSRHFTVLELELKKFLLTKRIFTFHSYFLLSFILDIKSREGSKIKSNLKKKFNKIQKMKNDLNISILCFF